MYLNTIKNQAIKLRKEGYSYSFIASRLRIAKSTLSDWLKDVNFLPNETTTKVISENNKRIVVIKRVDKANSIKEAKHYAVKRIGNLTDREMFMLGLGIYIGEGSKSGNFTRIVNSDPNIIRFSMRWLKRSFGLSEENFRIRIHLYPDNNEEDTIKFWMKSLGVNRKIFHTSYIDRRINKKKSRAGVLPYGTAHMSVVSNGNKNFGVLLQRKIIASIDQVLSRRD